MSTDNDSQSRSLLDPSFDIFDVLRWATHTAYPEARIPETPMPNWTPGPWRFTNSQLLRVNAGTVAICGVHRIGKFSGESEVEPIANGHLIAAAPELAAQLEEALIHLQEAVTPLAPDWPEFSNGVRQCALRCGAILAKARGDGGSEI